MEASSIERLKSQTESAGQARLIRSIELLSSLEPEMKWSTQPRVLFELAAVKLCRPQQEDSMEALLDRIEILERQLKKGIPVSAGSAPIQPTAHTSVRSSETLQRPRGTVSGVKPAESSVLQSDDPSAAYSDQSLDDLLSSLPAYGEEAAAADSGALLQDDFGKIDMVDRRPLRPGTAERIERAVDKPVSLSEKKVGKTIDKTEKTVKPSADKEAELGNTVLVGSKDPVMAWQQIMQAIGARGAISSFLVGVRPRLDTGDVLTLIFPDDIGFGADIIKQESNKAYIEEQVLKVTGRKVRIRCLTGEEAEQQSAIENSSFSVKKVIEAFGEDLVKVIDEE
jgi:hypothetical protein